MRNKVLDTIVVSFTVIAIGILAAGTSLQAATIEISWDYEPNDTVTGFRVYMGHESGNYKLMKQVSMQSCASNTCNYRMQIEDGAWYFAVTAFNQYGESEFSEEVDIIIDPEISSEPATLFFPHTASNQNWDTEIAIINRSDHQVVDGVLKAFDDFGETVSDNKTITLAPHAKTEIVIREFFDRPEEVRYVILESNSDKVAGYMKFFDNGGYRTAVSAVSKGNMGDIYLPHIASDGDWWTGISLLNTTSVSQNITIDFDNGATKEILLPAKAHSAFTIRSLFGEESQPSIHAAAIRATNSIIALGLVGNGGQLMGVLMKDRTATELFYPHVADDVQWKTGLAVYNPTASATNMAVTAFSSDGAQLSSQFFHSTRTEHSEVIRAI